jgi:hypothetical protein
MDWLDDEAARLKAEDLARQQQLDTRAAEGQLVSNTWHPFWTEIVAAVGTDVSRWNRHFPDSPDRRLTFDTDGADRIVLANQATSRTIEFRAGSAGIGPTEHVPDGAGDVQSRPRPPFTWTVGRTGVSGVIADEAKEFKTPAAISELMLRPFFPARR